MGIFVIGDLPVFLRYTCSDTDVQRTSTAGDTETRKVSCQFIRYSHLSCALESVSSVPVCVLRYRCVTIALLVTRKSEGVSAIPQQHGLCSGMISSRLLCYAEVICVTACRIRQGTNAMPRSCLTFFLNRVVQGSTTISKFIFWERIVLHLFCAALVFSIENREGDVDDDGKIRYADQGVVA